LAVLNPDRAVRKKIRKISAERMWTGARLRRKKKKIGPASGEKTSVLRPDAHAQPPPAPARMAGVYGPGVGAQWCGLGGWRTHSPTHCQHCLRFFFPHWPHCRAPTSPPPETTLKTGRIRAAFGAGWGVVGLRSATPSSPHPEARKQGISIASIDSIAGPPTPPLTPRR